MIPRAPLRFLGLVVGGWAVGRVAWLMPLAPGLPPVPALVLAAARSAAPAIVAAAPVLPRLRGRLAPSVRRPVPQPPASLALAAPEPPRATRDLPDDGAGRLASQLMLYVNAPSRMRLVRAAPVWRAADPLPGTPARRAVTGYAYLFVRPGGRGGASLGPGGQLGASQFGARIAYPVAPRLAVAARLSTPVAIPEGSEAALGVEYAPRPATRIAVERRVALGRAGRDAWSAYAAGGFYEGLGHGLELDGYGQAGVVGARRRDLFADGALRGGRRLSLDAERALVLGAGAWGAAQPGAARLDVGPRAALGLPLGDLATTLALEGRLRVAGKARPGSGMALTLATDF